VVERTAHTPGVDRLLPKSIRENRVGREPEREFLVSERIAGSIIHRDRPHVGEALDVVPGRSTGIHALNVDVVARSGRDVLDLQSRLNSPAPLVGGMAGRLNARMIISPIFDS